MIIYPNVAHLMRPLSDEHVRARNAGRKRDAQVYLDMLHRLESVGRLSNDAPIFRTVAGQATDLLHEAWRTQPPSVSAMRGAPASREGTPRGSNAAAVDRQPPGGSVATSRIDREILLLLAQSGELSLDHLRSEASRRLGLPRWLSKGDIRAAIVRLGTAVLASQEAMGRPWRIRLAASLPKSVGAER